MEDENRLELSLAPPSTGGATTAAARFDIHDRDTKLINEFKHFLDGGTVKIGLGPGIASQMKQEISIGNTSNTPTDVEASKNINIGGFWITNDRDAEGNEETREKRKNAFAETTSHRKKHEKEIEHLDWHDKSRASHIFINTNDDDDSAAENEDVVDSNATTLRPFYPDFHGISCLNSKLENVSQGVKFPNQSMNTTHLNTHRTSSGNLQDLSEFTQCYIKPVDHTSSSVKSQVEGVSSTFTEQIRKVINTTSRTDNVFPSKYQTIKPGFASDLKFGGCGSYPNLPWVSTTGSGANNQTISGVTYRYSPTQIRIVCACHGIHLSPEEFVLHANEMHVNQNEIGPVLVPIATSTPAASAKS